MYIKYILNISVFSLVLMISSNAEEPRDQTNLPLPVYRTVMVKPCYSAESIMRHALLGHDPDSNKIEYEQVASMTADKIMLSDNLVARLSCKEEHAIEASTLYNLVQKMNLMSCSNDELGFHICLPISIISIAKESDPSTFNGRIASIVIMPKAEGRPLCKYIDAGNRGEVLGGMLNELGQSLAMFQTRFMEKIEGNYYTAAHGDFHENNIFCHLREDSDYSGRTWSFSLIDCGTMETKRMHPLMDPLYFLCRTTHYLSYFRFSEATVISLIGKFYKGYLGRLDRPVVEFLKPLLPQARSIAQHEEGRMSGLLFIDPKIKNSQQFLENFDRIHNKAVNSIIKNMLPDPSLHARTPKIPVKKVGLIRKAFNI